MLAARSRRLLRRACQPGRHGGVMRTESAVVRVASTGTARKGGLMSRVIADRFQRWFEYERDAHAKVLRSLESVPPGRRSDPEFARAVATLAHVAAARGIW